MLRIGVLASHEGTTLQCILDACASGRINGCVAVVISNNGRSGALRRATASGSASLHLSSVTHRDADSLDEAIRDALLQAGVQVVFLGGYMKRLGPRTLAAFHGRILNTHPALLPKFGGQGMFGDRVFEAVLAARELESGASVHLVEAEYDTGAVLRQGRVPVFPGDDVESLKARVQACERELVIETLAAVSSGELALEERYGGAVLRGARVPPVLVTGATGRIGGAVVAQLLAADVPVRALTRRPDTANLPAAVEVVAGDLTVPESLDAALHGVSSVFLLWTAAPATVSAVIDRLKSHVRRVVFLSSPHRTPHPFFQQPNPMAVLHADIERRIAAAGLASTIIRPGMFASNARFWWGHAIREGAGVRWPYAAAEAAPIDERDVAAVTARALYEDGHEGGDYVLTGPESLSQREQVNIIGSVIGRPIRFEELSPEEFRRETAETWPRPAVDMLLAAWGAALGRPAFVTSDVADVLGSPARTFRQWAVDHAEAFRGRPAGDC